jgi:predicted nucleic acid-binding protein
MTLILDSGGLSALAGQRARLAELRRRGEWPPQIPSVVLTEALTGDHRRDFHENRLISLCQVRDVTAVLAREGARLRTLTGRAGTISATDAIVAAMATTFPSPVVLTSDPEDMAALVAGHTEQVIVSQV